MSVVGFDIGNESCVVAVGRDGGIDVVLNDESKRETPALVCFGEKQRFLGTAGAMMNPKNTISQIKRLIGRPISDPELEKDLKSLPFTVTETETETEGGDGFPLIQAHYLGETKSFTPTQVMGMVFTNMKTIAEKSLNAAVVDCCIGIPVYFTELQRRAVMDAAIIAGLRPLRLMHETTATALAYGIYKTDLPEKEQLTVAFVDIGHASMQVCIAGFKKGQLKVLAHSFDPSLGGRDFDDALFHHFAAKFKAEYKLDVYPNARASLRLRAGCEKLKKVLSANPEAPLNIECLMDDKDVRGFITRDEFEEISAPVLERVKKPLEKALLEAQLTTDDIGSVEVVGSGSRVPAVIKILTEFFRKEPRRTMNASECVSKGCALECAILSPTFEVKEFQVQESFPFPVALTWQGPHQNGNVVVFPKGSPIPSVKALTFYRAGTFTVDVQYADVSELKAPAKISTYTIGPFQAAKGETAKVKVKARLNLHGIVSIESAQLIEEEEVEVPVTEEATKMEDASVAENGAPETGDHPVHMETGAKWVEATKKKAKKSNIPVKEVVHGGMLPADVHKAVDMEFDMALQDRVMEETKDKKNAVESYVYDMRNKLYDKLQEFVTESEKEALIAKLQETEDWLYEDGEDETKGVYAAKLDELQMLGDLIEQRYKEHSERGPAYRQAPKYKHINKSEQHKLVVSQERDNSIISHSCPRPANREDSQIPPSSTGHMSDEFELKIQRSLSRFGFILESLHTDITQINKGTKELTMDMVSIHQKLHAHGNSLQTILNSLQIVTKGQGDTISKLHEVLKSLSETLHHNKCHQNSQQLSALLSGLEEKIRMLMLKLHNDLSTSFTTEIQALVCKLKALEQKNPSPALLPPKDVGFCAISQGTTPKNSTASQKVQMACQIPKVEMGAWKPVKREANEDYSRVSQTQLEREWSFVTESDEESDRDFTFLSEEKETGSYLMEKAKEETGHILRKARRRRKRKRCNTIVN